MRLTSPKTCPIGSARPTSYFKRRFVAPGESTIRRVLEETEAAALDLAVGAWLFARATRDDDGDLVIALDGNVLRGAWTDEKQQVTLFSVMFHREGVVVAQTQVPDGTNEITQVENLLENIATAPGRTIVTLDAAHTQRETDLYLQKRGIDYLMNVKGTIRPFMSRSSPDAFRSSRKIPNVPSGRSRNVVEERSHGRIRRWMTWTTTADGIDFPNAATVAVIRREEFDLANRRVTKEYAFIITSLHSRRASAETIHTHVRQHWGIENRVHYVRDTIWREDANQTYSGNGPHNLAVLQNLALSLFWLHGITKVKETTEFIARARNRALTFLAT